MFTLPIIDGTDQNRVCITSQMTRVYKSSSDKGGDLSVWRPEPENDEELPAAVYVLLGDHVLLGG